MRITTGDESKLEEEVGVVRDVVLSVFKAIRRDFKDIRTRANFRCCMGCALDAMALKDTQGFVYWHNQDDKGFREYGELNIRYCTGNGKGTKALGDRVFEILKRFLTDYPAKVEWDGNPGTVISVVVNSAKQD